MASNDNLISRTAKNICQTVVDLTGSAESEPTILNVDLDFELKAVSMQVDYLVDVVDDLLEGEKRHNDFIREHNNALAWAEARIVQQDANISNLIKLYQQLHMRVFDVKIPKFCLCPHNSCGCYAAAQDDETVEYNSSDDDMVVDWKDKHGLTDYYSDEE